MWEEAIIYNIQNFSCFKLTTVGSQALLTDTRDGNTYYVAKLKDGKCWMSQNLRLGGSSPITLTSATSDVSSNYVLPKSGTSGNNENGDYVYADSKWGGYYFWHMATGGNTLSSGNAPNSI